MGKADDVRRLAELHRQGVLTREEFNYRRQVAKLLDNSPAGLPAGLSQYVVAHTRERLVEQHRRGELSDGEFAFRQRMQKVLEQGELSWPRFRQAMVERLADTGHDVTDWQPPQAGLGGRRRATCLDETEPRAATWLSRPPPTSPKP